MKIMRVRHGNQDKWAIAENEKAYALQGDPYTAATKGALIGPLEELKILCPILPENKVVIILENWRDRAGRVAPSFVIKNPSGRINPGETIFYPKIAKKVYFETELGIVIAKKCKGLTLEQAKDHILGYTISNDMTNFEFTINTGESPHIFGKMFDTFSVLGPCIATGLDPLNLRMSGKINGEEFYDVSSGLMLWNAYELTAWVSQITTLNPGDVISCGAPKGAMLKQTMPGDRITTVIDGIGEMEHDVRAE
jgi:2-keto-4-pentenoate hydratase/2-oxohepta-3-ene-1,7-dioic acid hydratase in catechol pathway